MSKNSITGLFAVIFGAIYVILSLRLPHVNLGDPLGPKVFPLLIGILTIVLGVGLVVRERFTPSEKRKNISFKATQDVKDLVFRIGLSSLFGIIYGFLLDPLGYLLSTFIFMLLLMYVVNRFQRVLESIVVSVGFSLVTYVSFGILLDLSLPRGILYF